MADEASPPETAADTSPPTEGAAATLTETPPAESPPAESPPAESPPAESPPSTSSKEGEADMVAPAQGALDAFRATDQTAFVVGHTGECGKALVQELARTKIFSKVLLIGRREVTLEGDDFKEFAVEQKVVDFDNLDASVDVFKGPTVGYCCLGTTRGKAGKEGFKKVDHDYTMKVGELAKQNGCRQYHLVTSTGANKNSSILYSRVKGEVEEETADLGFEKLAIYRPGLLMCPRKEFRFGEWMIRGIMKPVEYVAPGSMTNTTLSVAQAMIARTASPADDSKTILDGKSIFRASKEITG